MPARGDRRRQSLGGRAALRLAGAEPARRPGALRPARQLLDVPIDTAELAEAEESYAEQVSEAVSSDDETAAYVAELENRTDELDLEEHEDLPSGDSLAAELTRFLRERDAENGDDPPREQ